MKGGSGSLKSLSRLFLQQQIGAGFEAGTFNHHIPGMTIYIEQMQTPTTVRGIFIDDRRDPLSPMVIVAKTGKIISPPFPQPIVLSLTEGSLHRSTLHQDQRLVFFSYHLSIPGASNAQKVEVPTYTALWEAYASGAEVNRQLLAFYRIFSFSLASFLMGLIGAGLGGLGRAGRFDGITASAGLIVVYYLLYTLGDYLQVGWGISPLAAALLPLGFLVPFCAYLIGMRRFPQQ